MTADWTKSQWRDEFKRRRMQVEPEIRGRILNHAREWILTMRPSRIQLYLPKLASHELDTTDLLRFCMGCGIPVAVPRVVDVVTGTMELVDWSADLPMVTNRNRRTLWRNHRRFDGYRRLDRPVAGCGSRRQPIGLRCRVLRQDPQRKHRPQSWLDSGFVLGGFLANHPNRCAVGCADHGKRGV